MKYFTLATEYRHPNKFEYFLNEKGESYLMGKSDAGNFFVLNMTTGDFSKVIDISPEREKECNQYITEKIWIEVKLMAVPA